VNETTKLFALFLSFWKTPEAHCFHYFLTDSPTKQSEDSENSELPDSSKTVKIAITFLWSQSLRQIWVWIRDCNRHRFGF